jgi:hypothetical protein
MTSSALQGAEPPSWTSCVGEVADLGVVVTDHGWRIESVGHRLPTRLGCHLRSMVGRSNLGFVHPDDAVNLLCAIEGAGASKQSTVARVRLQAAGGSWQELACFVTAVSEQHPPRLAVLLSGPGSALPTADLARVEELALRLWRIAMEVHSFATLARCLPTACVSPSSCPAANGRASRGWSMDSACRRSLALCTSVRARSATT